LESGVLVIPVRTVILISRALTNFTVIIVRAWHIIIIPIIFITTRREIVLAGNAGSEFNEYSPYLIQQQAIQFIGDHKNKPFFLFYATTLPHAELLLPEKEISVYRNKFLPEKEFVGLKPGDKNFRQGPYGYQAETHAAFAAMVTLLDKQVGEIMAKVKELGLDKNTIIMFSSDNGPHKEGGGDPDYFDSNGQLKGYKRDLYEGGIREPMLVSWPGRIKSRSTTAHVSAFWDLMPTFAEIAGVTAPENIQGISFLPTLLGRKDQREHADLYWEFHEQGGKQALLKGNWKLIRLNVLDPQKTSVELYDISTDIGEERNLAEKYPEKVKAMLKLMENSRVPNKDFVFIEGK
jgi:arylsulfatase A-like enzyme